MDKKREKELLDILSKETNGALTCKTLAARLDISVKTIRNDIKKLNDNLVLHGAKIVSKSGAGNGYSLEINDYSMFTVYYDSLSSQPFEYTQTQRIEVLILKLVKATDYMITQDLANMTFVCKEQTYNDLVKVKAYLEKKKIYLESKPKKGVKIKGMEFNKRILIAELLNESPALENDFYTIDKEKISIFIKEYVKKHNFLIPELVLNPLVQQILVIIQRSSDGFDIEDNNELLSIQREYVRFNETVAFTYALKNTFDIQLNDNEIGQIAALIEGCDLGVMPSENIDGMCNEVRHLLDIIYEEYTIDLRKDEKLINDLGMHIYRMFLKLDYETQYEYDVDSKVVSHFPLAFELARFSIMHLVVNSKISSLRNEAILITFHFELALERMYCRPCDILLAIETLGRGEVEFMKQEFNNNFAAFINTLTIKPLHRLLESDYAKYDQVFVMDGIQRAKIQPFSSKGKKMIQNKLRGLILKEEKLAGVFKPHNYIKHFACDLFVLKNELCHLANVDYEMIDQKNDFISIKVNPHVSFDFVMNTNEVSELWIGVCQSLSEKNKYEVCIIYKQGRNGVIDDRAIYNALSKLEDSYNYLVEQNIFESYQKIKDYLIS